MNTQTAYARIARRVRGSAASDGAGVKLTRVIGGGELPDLDPFLLLDEFGTDRAEDYLAGFPDHPHRGFETVTYMLDGRMRHRDNHGNEGLLVPGSVQWMTAGRGLVHSEMPEQQEGRMRGFQLWVNLPAKDKMTEPRYQEFPAARIPVAQPADGVEVKVIAGEVANGDSTAVRGPIVQPATEPLYLDVALVANAGWDYALPEGHNAFAYVFEGAGTFSDASKPFGVLTEKDTPAGETLVRERTGNRSLVVFDSGDEVTVQAGDEGIRFLLVSGKPIEEPIAWYGPIVMNTRDELMQARMELSKGTFIK